MHDRGDTQRGDGVDAMPGECLTVEDLDRIEPLAATQAPPSEQSTRRRGALAMYLEQLEETRRSGVDLREALDGTDLNSWELEQLRQGLESGTSSWQTLVAEGVAFRNKYETDLSFAAGELASDEIADFRRIQITNAALGLALLEETQQAVNQLILVGEIDVAKKLTGFRNKIGQSLKDLETRVGADDYSRASSMSEQLVSPAERASWTERATPHAKTPAPPKSRPSRAPSKKAAARVVFAPAADLEESTKDEETKSRIKPLLIALGLSVGLWAVFILPGMTVEPVPSLTIADVAPRAEIRHVVGKAPSLYVELDSVAWSRLSEQERLSLVDDVGATAQAAGYNGVHFKFETGRTAASWLKQVGSRLTE